MTDPPVPRSGFIAVAGRPNVGKSTLVNALVGAKVAVVSDKSQTTRRAIRGIVNGVHGGDPFQLVLVDLPGFQHPRDALTERMQRRVERALEECDAALFVLNGAERSGAGDGFIARALHATRVPVVVAVNKVDLLDKPTTAEGLVNAARLEDAGLDLRAVFPVSALSGAGVEPLLGGLADLLPEGPVYYPGSAVSDQPREIAIAELVREQALRRTREEVPHSIEVQVVEIEDRDQLKRVRAVLWVESESQKGILIGKQGSMVRAIGTAARLELERTLETRVHLDLTVKVRKSWRRDDALLDRLGIEP
jgi:GTP-binding protein Era